MHSNTTTQGNREGTNALLIAIGASAAAAFVALQLGGCTLAEPHARSTKGVFFMANDVEKASGVAVGSADQRAMQASMFMPFNAFNQTSEVQGEDMSGGISQMSFTTVGEDFDPDVDPSGSFMVYASTQHNHNADIYRKDVAGRTTTQLTNDAAEDVMPEISPDGSKIAFASDRSGNWDVFVMPIDGGPTVQITFEESHELHPTWSSDGMSMAYSRFNDRSAQWEIWTVDVESPSARHFVCEGIFPRWCPNGNANQILFQRARKRGEQLYGIWVIEIRDGNGFNPTEVVAAGDSAIMHPAWNNDGTKIAYTLVKDPTDQEGEMPLTAEIWCVAIDGTGHTALTTGGFRNMRPTWSGNDRVFFSSNRGGIDTIWSVQSESEGGVGSSEMASFDE